LTTVHVSEQQRFTNKKDQGKADAPAYDLGHAEEQLKKVGAHGCPEPPVASCTPIWKQAAGQLSIVFGVPVPVRAAKARTLATSALKADQNVDQKNGMPTKLLKHARKDSQG